MVDGEDAADVGVTMAGALERRPRCLCSPRDNLDVGVDDCTIMGCRLPLALVIRGLKAPADVASIARCFRARIAGDVLWALAEDRCLLPAAVTGIFHNEGYSRTIFRVETWILRDDLL